MATKIEFATKVKEFCTAIMYAHIQGYDAREIYNDRQYNPGGSDAIIDADVASLGVKAIDIEHAMVLFENLQKFMDSLTPSVADYRGYLNKMREDL
jgi:hypothetical protein